VVAILDAVAFDMELSCGCAAASVGTRLGSLRGRAGKRRAGVDQLFALREPTWFGYYGSGAFGGPKRVGDGAFYATGSVDFCQRPLEESRSVTDRSVLL